MLTKEQVLQQIKDNAMVAVVRGETPAKAREIVEKCIEGGITSIELTFTVPFAHRVIEEIAKAYEGQILLGAGTVLDPETARIAILSGAQFVVAPHFNPDTVRLCNRYRIANMAGILTVKEAVEAMEAGVDILKLFPGDLFGPAFIKDIRGPLPYAQIMPTGGVDISNAGAWIKAGAVAIGAGSSLMKGDVKANAMAFMEEIRKARG
ncbi:MAG: bifunctional 2-keto-4-hydroxyglutarate aldolase/2-keto-3-deoxy-6-phosphogluconate aldolase [Clostridia bacterium]|nr:bifunctional 2-keto-4-hydroxyglutarate aldolase/2-keto-3-deoxy-6-phosphogluconate aldolase [Clostridia bacterium]